jgi:hypothetical protein
MMCAECHSTNLHKNYDVESDTYQTAWDALNVGCQACHGPGQAHVDWARSVADRPATWHRGRKDHYHLLVDFQAGNAAYQVDVCATCHSRRQRLRDRDQPGRPFLDNYRPMLLRQGLYHADGQQLDEVYEYGSFLQSKMYENGARCTDCHEAHTLKLKARDNEVCMQCHSGAGNPRFATLKHKSYDTPEHHFHKPGSPGALCINCHMPVKNYMQVQARPDHSLRVPRPDLSVRIGTPNACNGCHREKSAAFAAETVARWYGKERRREAHFGDVFALARAGSWQPSMTSSPWPQQPAIADCPGHGPGAFARLWSGGSGDHYPRDFR